MTPDDFEALYAVGSDPLIWAQHPESDRWTRDVFERFFRGGLESGGALIAIDRKDDRVIGSSRYYGYDPEHSEIEVGWTFLARSYWGGRYNGEMKDLMLRHAFTFVDNVVLLIGPENTRSRRAAEKIGGVLVEPRPNSVGLPCVVYRVTASTLRRSPE